MSLETIPPYHVFNLSNIEPVEALIKTLSDHVGNIRFGADFAQGTIVTDDGEEAIQTYLGNEQLPACGIYEEKHLSEPVGIGGFGDSRGLHRYQRIVGTLTIDVWARNPQERELVAGVVSAFLFDNFWTLIKKIGFIEFADQDTRVRGFDLTDRILQFHSHQITNIWRRLMFFNVTFERKRQVRRDPGFIRQFVVTLRDQFTDEELETFIVGDEEIPYPILKEMKQKW